MIALRIRDSRTALIPPDQKAFRLGFFGDDPFPTWHRPCEGLSTQGTDDTTRLYLNCKLWNCLQFITFKPQCQ